MSQIYFEVSLNISDGFSISYPLANGQQYLFDICLLQYVQYWTADDGHKDRSKLVVLLQ